MVDERLQAEIDAINEARKQSRIDEQTQSETELLKSEFLNLGQNFRQGENEHYREDTPTFELDRTLIDWADPKYNEHRSFNIKSLRDVFFALLNQSRCQQRVCDSEE